MFNKIPGLKKLIVSSAFFLLSPLFSFAASNCDNKPGVINNPLCITSLPDLIAEILGYVTKVGGVVAICAFIWIGWGFIRAQGNTTKLSEAKKNFFYVIVGVAILLGAQLLAYLVVNTIGSLGK